MEDVRVMEKAENIFERCKKFAAPAVAVAVGAAATVGLLNGDEFDNSVAMPDVPSEQSSIDQIDADMDQTEKRLEQLDQTSENSDETDYALMGC